jgi:hypothetical protein
MGPISVATRGVMADTFRVDVTKTIAAITLQTLLDDCALQSPVDWDANCCTSFICNIITLQELI